MRGEGADILSTGKLRNCIVCLVLVVAMRPVLYDGVREYHKQGRNWKPGGSLSGTAHRGDVVKVRDG